MPRKRGEVVNVRRSMPHRREGGRERRRMVGEGGEEDMLGGEKLVKGRWSSYYVEGLGMVVGNHLSKKFMHVIEFRFETSDVGWAMYSDPGLVLLMAYSI